MFEITLAKNKKNLKTAGISLISIFILLILVFEIPYLKIGAFKQGTMLLYAIYACYYCAKYLAVTFTFIATDEKLIIKKATGKKIETPLNISLSDVILVAEKNNNKLSKYDGKPQHLSLGRFEKEYYILVCKVYGEIKKFKIEMNCELKEGFKKILGDRLYE